MKTDPLSIPLNEPWETSIYKYKHFTVVRWDPNMGPKIILDLVLMYFIVFLNRESTCVVIYLAFSMYSVKWCVPWFCFSFDKKTEWSKHKKDSCNAQRCLCKLPAMSQTRLCFIPFLILFGITALSSGQRTELPAEKLLPPRGKLTYAPYFIDQ